jgi:predicted nucleotidyltransferase
MNADKVSKNPLIESHRSELEQLCKRYHVKCLELFGSAATGDFKPEASDLDFLVEFNSTKEMNAADQYFGLLEALRLLFQRKVDLVMARAMHNPYFIREVNKSRNMLYAA